MTTGVTIVSTVFLAVAVLLSAFAMRQRSGSPGRRAQLRTALVFVIVALILLIWHR